MPELFTSAEKSHYIRWPEQRELARHAFGSLKPGVLFRKGPKIAVLAAQDGIRRFCSSITGKFLWLFNGEWSKDTVHREIKVKRCNDAFVENKNALW